MMKNMRGAPGTPTDIKCTVAIAFLRRAIEYDTYNGQTTPRNQQQFKSPPHGNFIFDAKYACGDDDEQNYCVFLCRQFLSLLLMRSRMLTLPAEYRTKLYSLSWRCRDGDRLVAFRPNSRTAGRALSLRLRQIVGRRPKGTHDTRLLSRDAP